MTRKLAFVGFSYLTGLLLGSFFSLWLSCAAGGAFLCAGFCAVLFLKPRKSSKIFRCAVFSAACGIGMLLYSAYDIAVCRPVSANDGQSFSGECVIAQAEHYPSGGAGYIAKCRLPNGKRGKFAFYSNSEDELVRGDIISVSGTLSLPESGGFFDSRSYYGSMGVFLILDDAKINGIDIKENNIFEYVNLFRQRTVSEIRKKAGKAGKKESEAVIGMLFGNGFWDMPERTEKLMYKSGIGHVTSVSGMHMSIAAGIAAAIMTAAGSSKKLKFTAVCICTVMFALTADLTVSVMRSLIMIIMVYSAELFNRRSDPLTSLAAAVIILTAGCPFSVRSPSFMLSVSGVIGTAVIAPALIRTLEAKINARRTDADRFRAGALLSAAITAVSASAAVFPAAAVSFDEISVIAPITNMLLAPLCTASAAIAAIGAAISLVPLLSPLSSVLFCAAGFICKPVIFAAEHLGELPFAAIPSRPDISAPLLILVIVSSAVCAVLISKKTYAVLTFMTSVFICILSLTAYSLAPQSCTEIAVLTEGKGCVIAVSDGISSQIYDFMGTKRGADAAESYIARTGAGKPSAVMVSKNAEKAADIYSEKFPSAAIISPNEKSGLTYSAEDNIIKIGDCEILPRSGYVLMKIDGADIICINSKAEIPNVRFDLAVYNCTAPVNADSTAYAVTMKSFGGYVPPAAQCARFTTSRYIVSGGEIYPKEETKWLR